MKRILILCLTISGIIAAILLTSIFSRKQSQTLTFSGDSAYQYVLAQMEYGPRTPGSLAHQLIQKYLIKNLEDNNWLVEVQKSNIEGHEIRNIIARKGTSGPLIIIGAHYDSRLYATEESDQASQLIPVPGANDGASGVAVLLEIARVLPQPVNRQIWLVFFDAEDQGRLPGWDWTLGSRAFVQNLSLRPEKVIVLDMIGDSDLNIYKEKGSDPSITQEIWMTADQLGFQDIFIDESKYSILDDHLPFLEAGIPAVDIIDFDYPYWHTLEDTADKVSPESLKIVGLTITNWLLNYP